jgi:hypothetical protein
MNARLTQKPLDQVGTKESARCALCKFFFARKLFAQPNNFFCLDVTLTEHYQ